MTVPIVQVVKKPIDWFKWDNVRKNFERESLVELGKSLRKRQWHPVVAKSDGTVVDGQRRVMAAEIEGLETVDVVVIDTPMSQTELRLAQAATAIHRADLTPAEKYDLCYELAQLNPTWLDKDIAAHLCIDPAMITRIMSASNTIPEVRQAMRNGELSTADVYAFSKAGEADQLELLGQKLSGAITNRESLEAAVKERKTPASERPVRIKALIAGLEVTAVGKALGLSELIDGLTELLKLAKKAARDQLDLKTFESVLRDQARSGGYRCHHRG